MQPDHAKLAHALVEQLGADLDRRHSQSYASMAAIVDAFVYELLVQRLNGPTAGSLSRIRPRAHQLALKKKAAPHMHRALCAQG